MATKVTKPRDVPQTYVKLSPECSDGMSYSIVEKKEAVRLIEEWFENAGVGDTFDVELVEMTPRQFEELPQL